MPNPEIEHESGEREFRISIRYTLDPTMDVTASRSLMDVQRAIAPIMKEYLDEEMKKEVRPFVWRRKPETRSMREFDADRQSFELSCRGTYTD